MGNDALGSRIAGETNFTLHYQTVTNTGNLDIFDERLAEGQTRLAKFLDDDGGGNVGIQKAGTQDLADELVGAVVIGFGSGLLGLEGG